MSAKHAFKPDVVDGTLETRVVLATIVPRFAVGAVVPRAVVGPVGTPSFFNSLGGQVNFTNPQRPVVSGMAGPARLVLPAVTTPPPLIPFQNQSLGRGNNAFAARVLMS